MFKYTKAICRRIPRSIVNNGLRLETEETPLNYENAVTNHNAYIESLKNLGLEVTVLDADESKPDCVFVEDTAVIVGDTVLITNPGAVERVKEAEDMKQYFEKSEKKIKIVEMMPPACLDGGDVLFTGDELFVGESSRTNSLGIEVLQKSFPDYLVHTVKVSEGLHLKSFMSMVSDNMIICSSSPSASDSLKQLLSKATKAYSVVRVSDDCAANVVYVNGAIICRSEEEMTESYKEYEKLSVKKIPLSGKELSKVDGCFTCQSLLYN